METRLNHMITARDDETIAPAAALRCSMKRSERYNLVIWALLLKQKRIHLK